MVWTVAAVVVASLLAGAACQQRSSSYEPVVDLGYTKYRGVLNSTSSLVTYYGIPYVAAPLGDLRWRPPVPIEKSGTIRYSATIQNATIGGPRCIQGQPGWALDLPAGILAAGDSADQSEDCLTLDVHAPLSPRAKRLPVVVNIHGGGYTLGSAKDTDLAPFVSFANGNIIAVNVQYRLGVYGFLSSKEVRADGTANAGLLDQRAALEWVQRNIAAFGGDPDKVTIMGGSAGGGSVQLQMMLHGGEKRPPFHAAISEYPGQLPYKREDVLQAQYQDVLQAAKCDDLKCLRSLPTSLLANATRQAYVLGYQAGNYGYGDFYFTPSLDGKTINELPSVAFAAGRFSKVPLLTDRNTYEGQLFTNFSISKSPEQVLSAMSSIWRTRDQPLLSKVLSLYPLKTYDIAYLLNPALAQFALVAPSTLLNAAYAQAADIFGDWAIKCTSWNIASGNSKAGAPTWKLVFDAGFKLHGSTVPYLFGDAGSSSATSALGTHMKDYFISMIVNHNPNGDVSGLLRSSPSKARVPDYSEEVTGHPTVLYVNDLGVAAVIGDPEDGPKCECFAKNGDVLRN